jgi:hypothetical protein
LRLVHELLSSSAPAIQELTTIESKVFHEFGEIKCRVTAFKQTHSANESGSETFRCYRRSGCLLSIAPMIGDKC